MSRYRSSGWRNESARHSLAARGISSRRRSLALINWDAKKDILEAFKSPEERTTYGKDYTKMVSDRKKFEIQDKMAKHEASGLMTVEDHKRYMENDFAQLDRDFQDGRITGDQFNTDVDRTYNRFVGNHKKRLGLFNFDEEM